jgi:hypothetical protein
MGWFDKLKRVDPLKQMKEMLDSMYGPSGRVRIICAGCGSLATVLHENPYADVSGYVR